MTTVPQPERCTIVHIDRAGNTVDDPWATLGLDPGADEAAIKAAWLEQIQLHPPEKEPERALALREARDRLLDADRLYDRLFGTLHVPSPDAWSLPTTPPDLGDAPTDGDAQLDAARRIFGQLGVYLLVEDTFVKVQTGR